MKRKINIKKLEAKTIEQIIGVEAAYRRRKAFEKKHGFKAMTKEIFLKDYMKHQEKKINQIKAIIAKFNNKKAPIINIDCLEFRRLFSLRQNYIDPEKFSNELTENEWELFYNHQCESCNLYTVLHKFDDSTIPEFKEVSQGEFEKGIDEFYSTIKQQGDNLEEFEQRQGLKPIPQELMKHLSSEYAQQPEKDGE